MSKARGHLVELERARAEPGGRTWQRKPLGAGPGLREPEERQDTELKGTREVHDWRFCREFGNKGERDPKSRERSWTAGKERVCEKE